MVRSSADSGVGGLVGLLHPKVWPVPFDPMARWSNSAVGYKFLASVEPFDRRAVPVEE